MNAGRILDRAIAGLPRGLALVLIVAASLQATTPIAIAQAGNPSIRQRWLTANQSAIGRIHSATERAKAQKEFDAAIGRMARAVPKAAGGNLRAAAAAELAHPGRYQLADELLKPRPKTLWERFWSWVGDLWNRFWDALFGRVRLGPNGSLALGDVLLVLVGAGLLFALFRLLVNLQIERDARSRTAYQTLDAQRSAHALYLRASGLAAQGAFAEAVRALFAAAVSALDLRGIVHDDASATVGDVRRELRARDASLSSPFDRIAREFVAAAYAEQPIGAGDWERARDGYTQLIARHEAT